jgi:hypothetical protein
MFLGFNKFLLVKYIPGYKDILTQYYLLFLIFSPVEQSMNFLTRSLVSKTIFL